jgi:hypothetical protein
VRRYVIAFITVALVVLIAALLLPRILVRHRSLVDALAEALQLPRDRRDFFFVNLPPAAARYPGSVLVIPQMLLLERSDENDVTIVEGKSFTLECEDANTANVVGSVSAAFAKELISNKDALKVTMRVEDGQVLEMAVDQLKHRLLNSDVSNAKRSVPHRVEFLFVSA